MAVFRIERTRDYTVMSNHHLRNQVPIPFPSGIARQIVCRNGKEGMRCHSQR